jgi:hypothetical protein
LPPALYSSDRIRLDDGRLSISIGDSRADAKGKSDVSAKILEMLAKKLN